MSAALIGSILAPIVGGAIGNMASQGDREKAERLRQQGLDAYGNIRVPGIAEQELILEQLKSQGKLTPEMEAAILQGDSEMKGVVTDPRLKEAQLQALAGLQDVASQGGMSATDKVRFNQMQSELNRDAGAKQAAVMQDFARRGQAGSGMELAAQLMNQQASAERASQRGMDIKAQAEQRALEALMQSGQLGGQIQAQDFGQQAQVSQAQDAINRFNAANRQDVQMRNVQNRNSAQEANLGSAQRIADANVGLRNQQQMNNKGLVQQQFQNQMQRAGGIADQSNNLAGSADRAADRTAQMWSGIGQGVGQGVSAYGNKKPKKDEE